MRHQFVVAALVLATVTQAAPRLQGSNLALLLPRANPSVGGGNYYGRIARFGDIDGDGRLDVVSGATNGVHVFRSNANGTFAAPVSYLPAEDVEVLAVREADGVAGNDVIVTEATTSAPSYVRTLRNNSGTLTPSGTPGTIPEMPPKAAVADFNEDGRPDAVAAGPTASVAYVFLNDGAGGFPAAVTLGVTVTGAFNVATGDVNHDGHADFIVSGGGANQDSAAVLIGDGAGNFAAPVRSLITSNGVATIANLDGIPGDDLVAFGPGLAFDLLASNGDGTFAAPSALTTTLGLPADATTGHFNADSELDCIVLSWENYPGVRAMLGHGNGTFTAARDAFVGSTPIGIDAADLDGDGFDDVVTGCQLPFTTAVFINNRDGSFGAPQARDATGYAGLALADMDGDGRLDAVRPNRLNGSVAVSKGAGDGTFAPFASASGAGSPFFAATARLNADARPDVLVGNGISLEVYLNDGTGHLLAPATYSVAGQARQVSTGDLDGDGDLDVVVPSRSAPTVAVFLNDGAGGLAAAPTLSVPAGSAVAVALGRFDGDATTDLAVATTGEVLVYPGLGNGAFGATPLHLVGAGVPLLTAADFDGDGRTDLVGGSATTKVYTWRNDGVGGFEPRVDVDTQPYPASNLGSAIEPLVWDFDGDGAKDLLIRTGGQYLSLIPGTAPGAFGVPSALNSGPNVSALVLGDLDGDGDMDALAAAGTGNNWSMLSAILNRQEVIAVPPVTVATAVAIAAAWPNPARGAFALTYSVPGPGPVRIELVSISGRVVFHAEETVQEGGTHSFRLGGNMRFAPGIYAARILHAAGAASRKVVVLP
jgi:hypothetical protein